MTVGEEPVWGVGEVLTILLLHAAIGSGAAVAWAGFSGAASVVRMVVGAWFVGVVHGVVFMWLDMAPRTVRGGDA